MRDSNHENIRNENVNDIFMRNATASVLDFLNREIVIKLERDGRLETHEIPVFYNFAADEGFMKDFFMELPTDCKYPNKAEGNYEVYPRGILTLSNFLIRSGDVTNKFVRGSFTMEERDINDQKKMKAYSARLFSIPLTLRYTMKIDSDNLNKTFKIIERILDFRYKNTVRYFQFRGIRIPANIAMADSADFQTPYEFSYTDNKQVTSNFTFDVETYYPAFDDHSVRYKGNTISQIYAHFKEKDSGLNMGNTWTDKDDITPPTVPPIGPSLDYPPNTD